MKIKRQACTVGVRTLTAAGVEEHVVNALWITETFPNEAGEVLQKEEEIPLFCSMPLRLENTVG